MTASRLFAIALFVSVAVNILLAAALFSPHMRGGHHGPGARHALMDEQLATLSDDTRPKVEAIWKSHHQELRGSFREMRQARRALKQALTADTYDAAAVEAAMQKMDAALALPRQHLAEAIQESAAVMNDAERQAFFERGLKMMRPPHHGPRGVEEGPTE